MPNTPSVTVNFINNNTEPSTPMLGISHVVARTTKGPFNRPDEVLSTYPQFQAIYGEEIVPDGTVSNIKRAFELGSKLRVSRVAGATNPAYGYANDYSKGSADALQSLVTMVLTNPSLSTETITVTLGFKTKEQGSAIVDPKSYGLNKDFYLKLSGTTAAKTVIRLVQAKAMASTGVIENDQVMDSRVFISYGSNFIDVSAFRDFVNNVPNVEVGVVDIVFSSGSEELANRYKANGVEGVLSLLMDYDTWSLSVKDTLASKDLSTGDLLMIINEGSNGGDSDAKAWVAAYEAIASYEDAYALICSHVHQHLPENFTEVYKSIADKVKVSFETILYVEVPKESEGTPRTAAETLTALEALVEAIGQDKSIAYFGGGIKEYDNRGILRNNDVLGTVLGLGDTSASQYGPWYSFAGMNRGIVFSAMGPVMENLGTSNKKAVLQSFADWYMNLFVIKDTRYSGKRCMLWHSFTSHPKSDSYKFLSVARLNLYLKKNIRPILESYIEEPNLWPTWKNIYYEVKDILSDLVDRRAISEWSWQGDQDAQSYNDLSVNTEADVRAGKYHVILKIKDIVTLQEITLDVTTDSASGSISISEL